MPRPDPHTWTTHHHRALEEAALAVEPGKEAEFAEKLPAKFPHVERASFNPDLRRIEVSLGGGFAFPVPLRAAEAKPEPKPKA